MSVLYDYEAETEEEEEDEADISRLAVECNRQVKKRRSFTLLEKMAVVRTIQRNIEVRSLRIREACRQINFTISSSSLGKGHHPDAGNKK